MHHAMASCRKELGGTLVSWSGRSEWTAAHCLKMMYANVMEKDGGFKADGRLGSAKLC